MNGAPISHRGQQNGGFSLIELVVAVALLTVVMVPIMMTILNSNKQTGDLVNRTDTRVEARSAIDQFLGEVRQAQMDTATSPTTMPVTAISANSITFLSPNQTTPVRMRRVTYTIAGSELRRQATLSTNTGAGPWAFGSAGPTVVVARNLVSGSKFVGRTRDGVITTQAGAVRRADITLAVSATGRPTDVQTYTQTATIRTAR